MRVSDVMDTEPVAIPVDTTLDRAIDEYFLRYRWPWFFAVDAGHRFKGCSSATPRTPCRRPAGRLDGERGAGGGLG